MARSIQQPRQVASLDNPRRDQGSPQSAPVDISPTEHPTATAKIPSSGTSSKSNDRLDPNGELTPFERNQIFTRAAAGDEKAIIQLVKAGIIEKPTGEATSNAMLGLLRAGLDVASQYLPQGTDASRLSTGARGLLDNLGIAGAEANPLVEDYTNRGTRAVGTIRNILGGF